MPAIENLLKKPIGRPKKDVTLVKIKASILPEISDKAKKKAYSMDISFSAFVALAVTNELARNVLKKKFLNIPKLVRNS